jgi:hypothetical protein
MTKKLILTTIAVFALAGCERDARMSVDQQEVQLNELNNDNARLMLSFAGRNIEIYDLALKDNAKAVAESAKKSMQSDLESVTYSLAILERKNEVDRNSGDRALLRALGNVRDELKSRLAAQAPAAKK